EAFADMWGVETSVVEITGQIMPRLVSPALATMGQRHMEENGVTFYFNETVQAIEGENGRVTRVVTNKRTLDADAVIISAGVVPNSDIAKEAGLNVHERGGVIVDERMRTSDPDIYSGGDCAIVKNLITGGPAYLPLGSMANRQGRVIGTNLAGGDAAFDGVVGSFVVKLFEKSMAGTGLSFDAARAAGFDALSVLLVQLDRAHFYPTKELMTLEMTVDKATRRVLGVQGFGSSGDAMVGRINAVAAILKSAPRIEDISNMELAYSPPFAAAMDILNSLANLADNALAGINRGVGPDGFKALWDERGKGECFFLDCREAPDAAEYLERNPEHWHNVPQGEIYGRLDEIPKNRSVVLICNTGARSYEAQIMLTEKGYENVVNIQGGMAGIKGYGVDL
ncbi:MAG: FAD-dependent oxidoreductase, partial [Pseudodesulfovibrio sp.]